MRVLPFSVWLRLVTRKMVPVIIIVKRTRRRLLMIPTLARLMRRSWRSSLRLRFVLGRRALVGFLVVANLLFRPTIVTRWWMVPITLIGRRIKLRMVVPCYRNPRSQMSALAAVLVVRLLLKISLLLRCALRVRVGPRWRSVTLRTRSRRCTLLLSTLIMSRLVISLPFVRVLALLS